MQFHAVLELGFIFRIPTRRLIPLEVVFLPEDEHYDIGILLDRTRFAKVRKLRAFIVAVLDLPAELREGDDRYVQILCQGLQSPRDLRDFLHPVVRPAAGGCLHQLKVVDHDQVKFLLTLESTRPCSQCRDRQCRRIVDIERQAVERLTGGGEPLELLGVDVAAAYSVGGDFGLLSQNTIGELFRRHFQGEEQDMPALRGRAAVFVGDFAESAGCVEGDICRQGGFPHRRAARQNQKI